jgi:hypothetical protein
LLPPVRRHALSRGIIAGDELTEIRRKYVHLKYGSRVSLRSTQATILVMPALVAGIHVF